MSKRGRINRLEEEIKKLQGNVDRYHNVYHEMFVELKCPILVEPFNEVDVKMPSRIEHTPDPPNINHSGYEGRAKVLYSYIEKNEYDIHVRRYQFLLKDKDGSERIITESHYKFKEAIENAKETKAESNSGQDK